MSLPLECAFISDFFLSDGPLKASWIQWLLGRERQTDRDREKEREGGLCWAGKDQKEKWAMLVRKSFLP